MRSVRFSVVIPALNEAEHVRRAITSAWQAGASEVIVADGGSGDRTVALAEGAGARVIAAPHGRARQQNAGAAAAGGDLLLFLHADNHLHPDVGRQLSTAVRRGARFGALRQEIEAVGWGYRWLETGNAQRVRWLGLPYGDQAIFVRRDVFTDVGGFPEVPLLEDLLLMRRLKRRNWPALLPGPVYVSPRRWQARGIVPQTLRNWGILARYCCGASLEDLAATYNGPRRGA